MILPNNEILTHVLGLQHVYSLSRIHFLETLPPNVKPTGQFILLQESDDASLEHTSDGLDGRNVGNDASYPLLGLASASVARVASYGLAEGSTVVDSSVCAFNRWGDIPIRRSIIGISAGCADFNGSNICYTCNTSFKNATILATTKTNSASTRLNGYALAVLRASLGCKKD